MRKIEHSFGNLQLPMSKEQLTELVEKLRNKSITPDEVEQIVRDHLGFAIGVANRYSRNHTQGDLMFAEALYGIAIALAKAPTVMYDNEITPFLIKHMKKFALRTLAEEQALIEQMKKLEDVAIDPKDYREPNKELRASIYDLVQNEFEHAVVKMRELGLTDLEIADKLSVERKRVSRSRQRIYARFLEEEEK